MFCAFFDNIFRVNGIFFIFRFLSYFTIWIALVTRNSRTLRLCRCEFHFVIFLIVFNQENVRHKNYFNFKWKPIFLFSQFIFFHSIIKLKCGQRQTAGIFFFHECIRHTFFFVQFDESTGWTIAWLTVIYRYKHQAWTNESYDLLALQTVDKKGKKK